LAEDEIDRIWLTKSKLNSLDWCPAQFYWQYIMLKPSSTMKQRLGRVAHNFHELLYKNLLVSPVNAVKTTLEVIDQIDSQIRPDIENIIELTQKGLEMSHSRYGNKWRDYFFPVLNEAFLNAPSIAVSGVVDCVFLDLIETQDEYIIFELKSQSQKPMNDSKRRREIAFYKLLLEGSGVLDKPVRYGAMYFSAIDTMVFEPIKKQTISALEKKMRKTREIIAKGEYECKSVLYNEKGQTSKCLTCGYSHLCPMDNGTILYDTSERYKINLIDKYKNRHRGRNK